MKLSTILDRREPTLSFEVFPPKSDATRESIQQAAEEIAALHPDFMSITYGAGGGVGHYTLSLAEDIKEKYHLPVLAHLTCVSSTRETVAAQIDRMKTAGIENVMALRGDIPDDMRQENRDKWHYRHALDLIQELKEKGDFCIGAACYPEVHPESQNQKEDIRFLKEKADAGCSFFTTQMFFDNNLLYNFLYKIREAGITIPVIAGIMPITNGNQVERAIKLSGSHMPQRFKALVNTFGTNSEAMKQAGIAYATDQIIDLLANGIRAIHVYSMNKPDVAAAIQRNLSAIIPIQ
ncbi:MAG: methylenetetrahydrofolate reductase [Clostridia bacterium]|nr:methylenetetrahydrofolate reductase [NAD(P)H] [Clostridia bacterium]